MPVDLFPKLTEETKVFWTYLLLDDKMRKAEQQTTAGSDRIRSLYSPGKTYNLVYIITHDYSTIEFRNLWRPSPASLRRGGAGPLHISPHPANPPWAPGTVSAEGKTSSSELHRYWYCLNAK